LINFHDAWGNTHDAWGNTHDACINFHDVYFMIIYSMVLMSDVFILWVVLLDVLICIRVLYGEELMYIFIGWLHDLNVIVFYNESSTYNLSCLVCLNVL